MVYPSPVDGILAFQSVEAACVEIEKGAAHAKKPLKHAFRRTREEGGAEDEEMIAERERDIFQRTVKSDSVAVHACSLSSFSFFVS